MLTEHQNEITEKQTAGVKRSPGHGSDGSTIIDEIVSGICRDLTETKRITPENTLTDQLSDLPATLSLASALRPDETGSARIISELKKASPSKGIIRDRFEPVPLARELVRHGAAALSVLTETNYFKGSPEFLRDVASEVSVPVLRKDFIVDPYQVYEARVWGADAVLLIAAALDAPEFKRLFRLASSLGLDALAEVHNRNELEMVLAAGAQIVGVNSRDLRTFTTDLNLTESLVKEIPGNIIAVAESGIKKPSDIARMRACGVHAFLVGEALMSAALPGIALAELLHG